MKRNSLKKPISKRKTFQSAASEIISKEFFEQEKEFDEIPMPKIKSIIIEILQKEEKISTDMIKLTFFLSKIQKLVQCIKEVYENYKELVFKISYSVNYKFLKKDRVVFRAFDPADKFYFIIRGKVSIIIRQEVTMNMNEYEFLDYLLTLKAGNENSLINNLLWINKRNFPLDFLSFDEFLEELFLIASGKSKYNFLITSFIRERPIHQELKEKIMVLCKNMKRTLVTGKLYKNTKSMQPTDQERHKTLKFECCENQDFEINSVDYCKQFTPSEISIEDVVNQSLFMEEKFNNMVIKHIKGKIAAAEMPREKSSQKSRTFKFSEKIKGAFLHSSVQQEKILPDINLPKGSLLKIFNASLLRKKSSYDSGKVEAINYEYLYTAPETKRKQVKFYQYFKINELNDLSVFGDLGMNKSDCERTATVLTEEDTYFGYLINHDYKSHIKECFDKKIKLNLSFLSEFGLFGNFLVKYEDQILNYYFLKEYYFKQIVFDELSKNIYMVKEGTYRLSLNSNLSMIDVYLKRLGHVAGESEMYMKYENEMDSDPKFQEFYNKNSNITLYETSCKDIINIEILDLMFFLKNIKELHCQFSRYEIVDDELKLKVQKEIVSRELTLPLKLECISKKGELFILKFEDLFSKVFKYDSLKLEDYIITKNRSMIKRLLKIKQSKLKHFLGHNSSVAKNFATSTPTKNFTENTPKFTNKLLKTVNSSICEGSSNLKFGTSTKGFPKPNSKNSIIEHNFKTLNISSTQNLQRTPASIVQRFNYSMRTQDQLDCSNRKSSTLISKIQPPNLKLKLDDKRSYLCTGIPKLNLKALLTYSNRDCSVQTSNLTSHAITDKPSSRNKDKIFSDSLTFTVDYEYPSESRTIISNIKSCKFKAHHSKIKLTKQRIANAHMEIYRPKQKRG